MTDRSENQTSDISEGWPDGTSAAPTDAALPPTLAGAERIVIWPHRSLGRDGTLAVTGVAAAGFAMVTAWVAAPAAWFVVFPAIIALASLAFAFWLNMRRAERLEIIDVSANLIRVMTSYLGQHHLVDRFNPHWVRIELSDQYKIEKRLILRESGRAVSVGDCLSPAERESLADELRQKIRKAREGLA
ncbi:DUF2244 domain-containing protein [Dichotomicrobium thermohalophilum]|uniref:Putative membrane protein n=1 Tax=Dichotomicrobium thermohalophilum TaxID=933063 RepID=A0A397Q4B0_9HYPH|nr:DUF2244 domain-containing protein [Dichotomicrobium thermohalophilum]RIA56186.1 putative membrane protein [Dichotomicrobium thermohalophilum]